MIDAEANCPTVPAPGRGTVGQHGNKRDSGWDSDGTSSLKRLAAAVLARDSGWDKPGTRAKITVPHTFSPWDTYPHPLQAFPGVPAAWCEGVARLAGMVPPDAIMPARWAGLTATSARLLQDHGAELHAAGWDALDLFGLHRTAPAANPPGWGLAWLLGHAGEVLDVAPDAVGMRYGPGGARLAFRRGCAAAKAGAAPAWTLGSPARC